MLSSFRTFLGVDLGGGKGKTTALCRLRLVQDLRGAPNVVVDDCGTGSLPLYDDRLIAYLLEHAQEALLAIDAPLTLTACVRCTRSSCPGIASCDDPVVRWFQQRGSLQGPKEGNKPAYTPYTQRAVEVVLHEDEGLQIRETLGQGTGPLSARAAHLRKALSGRYKLNQNLLEVSPRATLARLFPDPTAPPSRRASDSGSKQGLSIVYRDSNGQPHSLYGEPTPKHVRSRIARHYKRSGHAQSIRKEILDGLVDLRFGPGQWREFTLQSDHQFDALLCAYTAYLYAKDGGWSLPEDPLFAEDGWIFVPPATK